MDYKDRLPSEEEIMKSLLSYFDISTDINAIGDLNVDKMESQKKAGWYLDLSKRLPTLIKDFVNIYGYIYKNGTTSKYRRFYRGAALREAEGLKTNPEIGSFLSVSDNEEIAKRFGIPDTSKRSGKSNTALIRISLAENVPCVYVEDLKDREGNHEDEFLILPFTRAKNVDFTSEWNGIEYYSMGLEKQELPEVESDELETIKSEIIEEFPQFEILAKEYLGIKDEYELNYERIRRLQTYDSEDRKLITENQERLYEEFQKKEKIIGTFRAKFQRMLQGLCKQREKDIDMQREDERKEGMEKAKQEAQRRKDQLTFSIATKKQEITSNIEDFNKKMKEIVEQNRKMAMSLGIQTFNTKYDISSGINGPSREIINLVTQGMQGHLETVLEKYDITYTLTQNEFPQLQNAYKEASFAEIKAKLNERIKAIIQSGIYSRFDEERKQVEQQKDTILQRLLGRNKLKRARLDNIDARLNFALSLNMASNPENSVRKMLQNMYDYAFKYNGGVLTPEMQEIEDAIRKNFRIDGRQLTEQDELKRKAIENATGENMPDIQRNVPRIFRWNYQKKETRRLDDETRKLYAQTSAINTKSSQKNSAQRTEEKVGGVYARISDTLDSIRVNVDGQRQYQRDTTRFAGDSLTI